MHDDNDTVTRERIEAGGLKLQPQIERSEDVHVATWLFWMKRAVRGGFANVVTGELPNKIDGVPQKAFITKPQPDKRDALIEKRIAVAFAGLPGAKKRELAELIEA